LEGGGEELQRQRNRLRQEEIVEEIELMWGGVEEINKMAFR
jgi:F-type H+-transporting ATPase subunit gamma